MCNRSPEMMKNGDAGIFPVYYNLIIIIIIINDFPKFPGLLLVTIFEVGNICHGIQTPR